ncbi:hypothetical protein CO015_01535 [candidate division WWE3 bacterium CG_4_8_14_3_um_filter_42_11]|uniref:HEAT repeat domain-containing protein n=3 Tax=Katanobacteria TaxID=422282 RepID=A0A2M7TCD5_UNCKA|nr:MAG: hypothetical protein COY34_01855 [candidate division WWE3 bacterium CG_4_10_14_0_2_um_filter_42_8]PJA37568.1 MAG: hypothetical protein CO181_02980 [candidate division WWE3 bacterium CG_4_9_14_3_um_filter_43_9]PJC69104.1 MAG: hypothetical protein CO015_01535 [candidate division WWE3 bacterium CG_4_8_14_3_um_filter_42_11]
MSKLNLQDFFADEARVKYGCAKKAIALSKEDPQRLYPAFDFFPQFLHGDKNILKWAAIQIIGHLSAVDAKKKVDALVPDLITLLSDKTMITAANAIGALSEIAKNKPEDREKILKALLKVEETTYYIRGEISPECTKVAVGHVIKALGNFGRLVYRRKDVRNFLQRQTENTRPRVRETAEKLLAEKVVKFEEK